MENQESKKEKKKKKKKLAAEEESLKKAWYDYRTAVFDNKSKSQDDFEKYINLMASGALALTITFLEKIVVIESAICKWVMLIGWLLLAVTLLSNLYSHYKSIIDSDKTLKDIDDENYDEIFTNIESRNKVINRLNMISIRSLIIGVLCIIAFVTINFYNMSDKQKPSPSQQPKPATEEKGRNIPPPPQNRPSNNPKK